MGFTSQVNNIISGGSNFTNIVIVNMVEDLPTAIGGKHNLLADTLYWFEAVTLNIGTNYLEMQNGTSLRGNTSLSNKIIYTGLGGAVRGTECNISISFISIVAGKAFDFTNILRDKFISIQQIGIINQTSQSTIIGFNTFISFIVNYINCVGGFSLTDNGKNVAQYHNWNSTNSGTFITLNPQTYTEINFTNLDVYVATGGKGIDITSTNILSGILNGNTFEGTASVGNRLLGVNGNTLNWTIQYGSNFGISGLQFIDVEITSTADATFSNSAGTYIEGATNRGYVMNLETYDKLATNIEAKVVALITSAQSTFQIGVRNLTSATNVGGLKTAVLPATLGFIESDYVAITPNRIYTAYYVKTSNTGGNVATRFSLKLRVKTY